MAVGENGRMREEKDRRGDKKRRKKRGDGVKEGSREWDK